MGKQILLGVTGSVAAVLTGKMIESLQELGDVNVVFTDSGKYFIDHNQKSKERFRSVVGKYQNKGVRFYTDEDEWPMKYESGDDVLHIELRKESDIFLIAPLSANTLAKIANGICDNLLTSVVRAWDDKPMIAAPAMNTVMWENYMTNRHIGNLEGAGWGIVPPIYKELACGDSGYGAMADIEDIVSCVKGYL